MNVRKEACCILNTFSPPPPLSSNPTPSQAYLLRQEKENQEKIALELQWALQKVAQSQESDEEPEPICELDFSENTNDLQPTPPLEASKSDEFEVC